MCVVDIIRENSISITSLSRGLCHTNPGKYRKRGEEKEQKKEERPRACASSHVDGGIQAFLTVISIADGVSSRIPRTRYDRAEFIMSRKVRKSPVQSYTIKLAEPHHLPEVLRIMRDNFYHEETMFRSLCSSASVTESEKIRINEYFDGTIEAAFNASPCVVAVDDETSEIVGANVTAFSENPKTGNKRDGLATIFSSKKSVPPLVEKYIEYLSKFNDEAKLFDKFPSAQAMWEFYAIAIDKNHRKLGLASDLMEVGVTLAKEAKVALVFGVFTSVYSRKSAEKVGMKTIMEFDLSAYKGATGTSVFKDTEPHNIVSVMVLQI